MLASLGPPYTAHTPLVLSFCCIIPQNLCPVYPTSIWFKELIYHTFVISVTFIIVLLLYVYVFVATILSLSYPLHVSSYKYTGGGKKT